MGLVENMLELVSVTGSLKTAAGLFVGFILYQYICVLSQNFKLARRGPRGTQIPGRLPLGKDGSSYSTFGCLTMSRSRSCLQYRHGCHASQEP